MEESAVGDLMIMVNREMTDLTDLLLSCSVMLFSRCMRLRQ